MQTTPDRCTQMTSSSTLGLAVNEIPSLLNSSLISGGATPNGKMRKVKNMVI